MENLKALCTILQQKHVSHAHSTAQTRESSVKPQQHSDVSQRPLVTDVRDAHIACQRLAHAVDEHVGIVALDEARPHRTSSLFRASVSYETQYKTHKGNITSNESLK